MNQTSVVGSGSPPFPAYLFFSDFAANMYLGTPLPPIADQDTSLDIAPITTAGSHDDDTLQTRDSKTFDEAFSAEWTLSSKPPGKWTDDSDIQGAATLLIGFGAEGFFKSKVSDEDAEVGGTNYIKFNGALPTFDGFSINWERLLWDILTLNLVEGAAGAGMAFTSDKLPSVSGNGVHKQESAFYWGTSLNSKQLPIYPAGMVTKTWQHNTSSSDNTAKLKGDIQGKVSKKEMELYDPQTGLTEQWDAHAELEVEATGTLVIDFPWYNGVLRGPDSGYVAVQGFDYDD